MQDQSITRLCACGCGKPAYPKKLYAPHHRAPGVRTPKPTCLRCGLAPSAEQRNGCTDEFHADARDRRLSLMRERAQRERVQRAAYRKRRYTEDPAVRAKLYANAVAWHRTHRERMKIAERAYGRVQRAIKCGALTRPITCEQCGATGKRIEAAHHDYSRPLDVRWLCKPCHGRWDCADPKTLH